MINLEKTVLVIEDEAEILDFVSRVLELEGFNVVKATDGEEGLRLALERHVDLILVDLRLPKLDGWELLVKLVDDDELSAIPKIVFSASAATADKERALKIGDRE